MQTTQEQAPVSPSTPVSINIVGSDGKAISIAVPRTAAQVADLRARRDELSSQLSSASERRDALATELPGVPNDAARLGLEERMRLLDKRILQIESDIAITGQQLSAAPAWLLDTPESRPSSGGDWDEGAAVGAFLMAAFVAVVYGVRRFRNRGKRKAAAPKGIVGESAERLERLEQGMESIAIEIERISEGQRFLTKLMSEQKEPARLT